ncbi:ABC transporter ATP-binding protein [Nonomuraea sp. bgisy101]|uniref:ABC transporter ATP-binding protein n=1 Tax=Nonomuraea sp. bgisy101 TaxID=3413784 RepID=UPI003D726E46
MSGLTVSEVVKAFDGVRVLRGASLSVREGSFAAVLGPSGCGKTTLLRIIAGFERADAGSVSLGEREVTSLPPEKRRVGIVPQEAALFPHLSVARNVGFGLPRGASRAETSSRVEECLELVGLSGYGSRMPYELSGGQQQRVALARALAPRPGVVLLDEPFNALDRSLRGVVRDEVRSAVKRAGATVVLVTHDQEEALSMADVVAVMRDGVIVQSDTPAEVYASPVDLGVATFVGEAVVLDAVSSGGVASCVLGRLRQRSNGVAGTGFVALRPEQVTLTAPAVPAEAGVARPASRASRNGADLLDPAGSPPEAGEDHDHGPSGPASHTGEDHDHGPAGSSAEGGLAGNGHGRPAGSSHGGGVKDAGGGDGEGLGTGAAAPRGRVARVEFFGHDAAVTVTMDDGVVIRARTKGAAPHQVGDMVEIGVDGPVLFFPAAG